MFRENNTIAIFGDIGIELRTSIPSAFSNLSVHSIINSNIDLSIGGTGGYLATIASAHFDQVNVFCRIGDDFSGRHIISQFQEEKVNFPLGHSELNTCIFIICYDNQGKGLRLIIRNIPNACIDLSSNDVDHHYKLIASSRIIFISGYYLFYEKMRRAATIAAMKTAILNGKHVAIDIVPHDIYTLFSMKDIITKFGVDNFWICEVPTIRRMLQIGNRTEIISKDIVNETIKILKYYGGSWLLRFGPNNYEHQVLLTSQRELWIDTGYVHGFTDPRGFGETLAMEVILDLLNNEWK